MNYKHRVHRVGEWNFNESDKVCFIELGVETDRSNIDKTLLRLGGAAVREERHSQHEESAREDTKGSWQALLVPGAWGTSRKVRSLIGSAAGSLWRILKRENHLVILKGHCSGDVVSRSSGGNQRWFKSQASFSLCGLGEGSRYPQALIK